ncbi:MAG: 30S ribosomal protein S14 [Alphaproteobacteria bacterium]|nr:30S ribosomal protein S14 [Alphaproteobacteria bacterium]
MAKKSCVERDKKRRTLMKCYASRRSRLRDIVRNKSLSMEERFAAQLKLSALPRNSSPSRIRNRCEISGRSRGYYRKMGMSRIALRSFASQGLIPGMVKSSW